MRGIRLSGLTECTMPGGEREVAGRADASGVGACGVWGCGECVGVRGVCVGGACMLGV